RLFTYPPMADLSMVPATLLQPDLNRLVGWFAGYIPSPLYRLRFLKMAARLWDPARRSSWLWIYGCVFALASLAAPVSFLLLRNAFRVAAMPSAPRPPKPVAASAPAERFPIVWQVVETEDSQTYSNGLRIENRFSVSSRPRIYVAFSIDRLRNNPGVRRSRPAGIVFHTTESQQAPFEASENRHLKRIGESALAYVHRNRGYNFLIDRFGRVYRIVTENQVANHAGFSVWAD